MNINSNLSTQTQFKGVNISKNTCHIMQARGELDAFNKFLPELLRKGKKANITVYAVNNSKNCQPQTTYGISIRPLNRLKDNAVTKLLGLSKNKQGDAILTINNNMATEKTFRDLYNSAYYNRNYKPQINYQG